MEELRPGLWTWTASHPAWDGPHHDWGPVVRSYALEAPDALVLFDPLEPPADLLERADGRRLAVIVTLFEHERSAGPLAERAGAEVFAPAAGLGRMAAAATGYAVGDRLPGDVRACTGFWPDEATLWIEAHRALVTGDVLLGEPELRLQPDDWIEEGASTFGPTTADDVRAGLRPLLDLPVELVLPTHGDPVVEDAAAALRGALEA
ncbi:MAG TPA: MBL fold metallo-hydrolase [Gaiellaceae bacterium]